MPRLQFLSRILRRFLVNRWLRVIVPFKPIPSLGNPKSLVSRKVNLEDDWNFLDRLAKIIRNTRISIALLRYIFRLPA